MYCCGYFYIDKFRYLEYDYNRASVNILRMLVTFEKVYVKDERRMIDGYGTIIEMAETWGVTRRRVQTLCSEGRIPGATRFGHEWAIPADTERPTDGRVTTGEYRNWRKKSE